MGCKGQMTVIAPASLAGTLMAYCSAGGLWTKYLDDSVTLADVNELDYDHAQDCAGRPENKEN